MEAELERRRLAPGELELALVSCSCTFGSFLQFDGASGRKRQ